MSSPSLPKPIILPTLLLSLTPSILLSYILLPPLILTYLYHLIHNTPGEKETNLPFQLHLSLTILLGGGAIGLLAKLAYERENLRLRKLGYALRPTSAGRWWRWIGAAGCAGYVYYWDRMVGEFEDQEKLKGWNWVVMAMLVGCGVCVWMGPVVVYLGEIWGSTVRADEGDVDEERKMK